MSNVGKTETIHTTNADNSWTSPIFKKRVVLRFLHLEYTSTATAGNRQIKISVTNAAGLTATDSHAGAVQAASQVYDYEFIPGIFRETSFIADSLQIPIPVGWVIDGNYKITISDDTNVDAADTMVISYQTEDV